MAYVAKEWLDSKQREARIKKLKRSAKKLSLDMQNGGYDDTDVATFTSLDAEIKRLEAIKKAETDVAFFAFRYFSDQFNPNNPAGNIIRNGEDGTPHETIEEIAPIHADMYDICDEVAWRKRSGNYVIAAPRGHAKTQVFSVILMIHQIVFRKRHYGLIISETDSLSKKIVGSISSQLKYNEKLREDFGELLHLKSLANIKDNEEAFITTTNTLIEASSAGKSLRGKTHGSGYRPDIVILDDISSLQNEGSEILRQRLIEWFNSVVMPLPAKNAAIVFVGTKVTGTGLLAHLLDRRDFKSVFHKAIIQQPDNPQLWSDYLHLYATEDDWNVVNEFYDKHREELEAGVILAWPQRWTYRELMHTKHNIGSRSFASEFMNESFAEDEQLFRVDDYEYCRRVDSNGTPTIVYNDRYIPIHSLSITGAWDVALAQTKRSALNAFVTIGREDKTGLIFVLDVYASREYPSEFIDRILEKMREYRHDKVVVEGIGAYWDFYRQLNERARVERLYKTRIQDVKSHGKKSKEQRIETLEPMFANKSLILNKEHHVLIEQLRNYIPGTHSLVDAIDALQIAIDNGGRRAIQVIQKPAWM
jgi:hypothetical protein